MKKIILILFLFLTGCTFMVKTPQVSNYDNLHKVDKNTKKNDLTIMLGAPQGKGIYGKNNSYNELLFYYGFAGKFSLSGADYDSGTAFITYKDDKPIDLVFFNSKVSGKEISFTKEINIKAITDSLQIGKSTVDDVIKIFGIPPDYEGKRVQFPSNINHSVAYWDASAIQQNGAIKEKWLLIGYDNNRIVQDIVWVSSKPEDIKHFGEVTEQQMKQMSNQRFAGILPYLEVTGMDTGTKIDTAQVDALIKTSPKNVQDIIKIIGKPSALGIKYFEGGELMSMSNWSFTKVEVKGQENNYIPSNATDEQKANLKDTTWHIMSIDQSRLMIGHATNGDIKEILWMYPIK